MDILEQVKRILWEVAGIDPAAVKPESEYRVDLGLGSADLIELLISIERIFGVRIDETETESVKTISQFVALIDQRLNQAQPVQAN